MRDPEIICISTTTDSTFENYSLKTYLTRSTRHNFWNFLVGIPFDGKFAAMFEEILNIDTRWFRQRRFRTEENIRYRHSKFSRQIFRTDQNVSASNLINNGAKNLFSIIPVLLEWISKSLICFLWNDLSDQWKQTISMIIVMYERGKEM